MRLDRASCDHPFPTIIVRKQGQALEEGDVIRHCLGRLAKFKVPQSVTFVDVLPRNATGKIHKPTLRKDFFIASATDVARAS